MSQSTTTEARKLAHLRLCCERDVEFSTRTTLLEDVHLVHQAVPLFSPNEADTRVEWLGRTLRAPLLIGAMTGGTPAARGINRCLAQVAQELGIGLALGSQRAMVEEPALADTYQVRDVAPDCLLLGNIGLFQARDMTPEAVRGLMEAVGADGICVHLNTAMEIFQPEGDQNFRRGPVTIGRLVKELGGKLIVKETGCGISRETAEQLRQMQVKTIDVAGAGGTSWVKIENLRRGDTAPRELAALEEWGIPTAACLLETQRLRLRVIASGGIRSGLDMAKAIALGADLCSCALPFLRAHEQAGADGVRRLARGLLDGLRIAMVLTGCRTLRELGRAETVLTGELREWRLQRQIGRKTHGQ